MTGWQKGFSHFTFTPSLLVKAITPDGNEYDLSGIFGEWLNTLDDALTGELFESSRMSEQTVQSFWRWSGRTDPPPKSLTVYIRVNPEFGNQVLMAQAYAFVSEKLNGDRKLAEDSLLRGLRNGHIKSWGRVEKQDAQGNPIHLTHIQFSTRDLVKWLKLEFNIKVSKYDIACYPDSAEVLNALALQSRRK